MNIKNVENWEKAVIMILNFDGWELEPTDTMERYDAIGYTPKGHKCVMEMKFRNKYYDTKLIEKSKYDYLMSLNDKIVKLYFVADPKGNYMFWLNDIDMSDIDGSQNVYAPRTSFWGQGHKNKEVYMLKENLASIININDKDEKRLWDDYFNRKK